MLEIDFYIYENPEGKIVGFSLVAGAQSEAEDFCTSMPQAFRKGLGGITIDDGKDKIIFTNGLSLSDKTFEVKVEKGQRNAIEKLWKNPEKLALCKSGLLTFGFSIVLISERERPLKQVKIET